MKKFYTDVNLEKKDDGYLILLDGKSIKTPLKKDMLCPTEKLAQAIVEEWGSQGDIINPRDMPMMQLLNTAIDRVADQRKKVEAEFIAHLGNDTIIYRAEQSDELTALEEKLWQPLYGWVKETFDEDTQTTKNILGHVDNKGLKKKIEHWMAGLDDYHLTALLEAGSLTSSIIIGSALCHGDITAEQAFDAAYLEENYQAQKWAPDEQAAENRAQALNNLKQLELFLAYLN